MLLFFPNNFKFCAVKKDYKHIQRYNMKTWNTTVKDFRKYKKLKYK